MCILHRSYTYRLHNATSLEELYLDVATNRVSVRSSNIHNKASCRYSYMLYQSFQCVQFCCVPLCYLATSYGKDNFIIADYGTAFK